MFCLQATVSKKNDDSFIEEYLEDISSELLQMVNRGGSFTLTGYCFGVCGFSI